MAFEDDLEPDLLHEAPFFLMAAVVYVGAIMLNPVLRWGGRAPVEKTVPIEFVAQLPAPSPDLAPMSGEGKTDAPPQKGEGEYKPEKVKEGAVDAPPKPAPVPKPAAVKSPRKKPGNTVTKAKAPPKLAAAKPKPVIDVKAIMAQSQARRRKMESDKAAMAAAAALAAQKAEEAAQRAAEAKAAAAARAEAARAEKARRDELAREAAAKRKEEARIAAEKRAAEKRAHDEQVAAERAARAKKKAELSQQLATMNDPDETLDGGDDGAAAPASGRSGKVRAAAGPATSGAAAGGSHAAGRAAAAAALADTAESPDPGDAAGSGGGDLLDAKAKGGGTGPDGEGVSWSLDGPVGSRRVLKRAVPTSPDWVGSRGLDLTVTVRFQVMPDGTVRPGAVIQKTSGFPEIDRRALDALKKWRFEAVPPGGAEVWGRVKFRFTS